MPKNASTHAWVALLSSIVYRCDVLSQYSSFQDARESHAKAKRQRLRETEVLRPAKVKLALNQNTLLVRLATEHFRDNVAPHQVCSLPLQDAQSSRPVFKSLRQALQPDAPTSAASDGNPIQMDVDDEASHETSRLHADPAAAVHEDRTLC